MVKHLSKPEVPLGGEEKNSEGGYADVEKLIRTYSMGRQSVKTNEDN